MSSDVLCAVFALLTLNSCRAFTIPDVQLEAYKPRGFKAYIPDIPGIKQFIFNGKRNGYIDSSEPGEINGEVHSSRDGRLEIYDADLQLEIGDIINYWVFVQYERLGYRKSGLTWNVTNFVTNEVAKCDSSRTTVSPSRQVCSGQLIFEDDFKSEVDGTKWTIEQYIPMSFEPNYEFVSYQNNVNNRFVKSGNLYLKPVAANSEDDLRSTLDLTTGCTHTNSTACMFTSAGAFILPPVVSAKITSKLSFKYGKVEVRAKLPAGDWIYPQIELVQNVHVYPRIFIAYARGNEHLTLADGTDIGATLLFGGVALKPDEPDRSKNLKSYRSNTPITNDFHTYTLTWDTDKIDLTVDGENFGRLPASVLPNVPEVQITLGVGVAGFYDFPDDTLSGSFKKPWKNKKVNQIKPFFREKTAWHSTWHGDDVALVVDYVKIWAI